jgi:RNA-directed DNA polymerase
MSTLTTGVQEWRDIPWPKVERAVHTLQRRIYRASQRGDRKVVHRLQRLLMSSWSAKCLAVRRVTQDNQGKKTAGIDGIASLEPAERLHLVATLTLDAKPQPARRVWIPKPGTDEQRPLGIPTLSDRALQALVKLALEPEWEAQFESNSYGFRPGRSCHDAVEAIFESIKQAPKYILDADIAKCFDCINHEALLDKINTFPQLRRLLKAWLKAGVLDGTTLFPTAQGTPQGGVISPLLANIALHGMEEVLQAAFPVKRKNGKVTSRTPNLIRYADDFVVCHRDLEVVRQCQTVLQEWLLGMGLELKPRKTRITHTLHPHEGQTGFDFLGFHIRQYPVGKYHTGKDTTGRPLGFKTHIKPSKEKVLLQQRRLARVVHHGRTLSQAALIDRLNPIIRGWCNYYRTVVSGAIFEKVDDVLYHLLRRWTHRRHPHKGRRWIARKYWHFPPWIFACGDGPTLFKHGMTKIQRHVKVRGDKSPFDGDWAYWSARVGHYPGIRTRLARLLRHQKGRCPHCGLHFMPGDRVEVHHRDGDHDNHATKNLEALHRHCHDRIHGRGLVEPKERIHDKDRPFEEPYEGESLMYGSEDQHAGRPAC